MYTGWDELDEHGGECKSECVRVREHEDEGVCKCEGEIACEGEDVGEISQNHKRHCII